MSKREAHISVAHCLPVRSYWRLVTIVAREAHKSGALRAVCGTIWLASIKNGECI